MRILPLLGATVAVARRDAIELDPDCCVFTRRCDDLDDSLCVAEVSLDLIGNMYAIFWVKPEGAPRICARLGAVLRCDLHVLLDNVGRRAADAADLPELWRATCRRSRLAGTTFIYRFGILVPTTDQITGEPACGCWGWR